MDKLTKLEKFMVVLTIISVCFMVVSMTMLAIQINL